MFFSIEPDWWAGNSCGPEHKDGGVANASDLLQSSPAFPKPPVRFGLHQFIECLLLMAFEAVRCVAAVS